MQVTFNSLLEPGTLLGFGTPFIPCHYIFYDSKNESLVVQFNDKASHLTSGRLAGWSVARYAWGMQGTMQGGLSPAALCLSWEHPCARVKQPHTRVTPTPGAQMNVIDASAYGVLANHPL